MTIKNNDTTTSSTILPSKEHDSMRDNPFSITAIGVYGITIMFYAVVYMVLMVLPFYALSQGENNTSIGAIMGITMISSMIMRPFAGRLIDRHGAHKIFVIALCVFAVSLLGYFFQQLWIYWFVRLVQGCVAACFSTAMEIITIDLLSKRLRAQGLSLYSLATMIPTTFGPALSLYLMKFTSFEAIFIIFFALGCLNIVFAFRLSRHTQHIIQEKKQAASGTLRMFFSQTNLVFSSLIMMFVSIANGAVFVFLPLLLKQQESHLAPSYFLVQMITLVIVRFWGSKWLPSDGSLSSSIVFVLCTLVTTASFSIYFSQAWPALLLAAILNGIGFALLYPSLLTFVSFIVEDKARGFYLGMFIGAADLGFALGSWVMGPIADIFSLQAVFFVCGVFAACAIPLGFLFSQPNIERIDKDIADA